MNKKKIIRLRKNKKLNIKINKIIILRTNIRKKMV